MKNFITDKDKKKKLIIIISAAVAVILILLLCVAGCVGKNKSGKKNICNLARTYAERGEYDRALDKLDSYLEKHGDDQDVWDLWNSILDMKKASGDGLAGGYGANGYGNDGSQGSGFPDNLKIDVDTSGISSAMQDSLSSMKDALAESNKQAEESRRAMESLMKMQENQKQAEEKRIAEQQAEAAQKKAEEEAAAEQKRKQEEKRKAEEEALAKKNAELKKKIDEVNDEIRQGQTALAMGNIEEAMKHFNMADSMIPSEAGKSFNSSKESEIAQSLYDAAQNATDPDKKAQLMNNAVAMARKAIESDPKDAGAHYIIAQNALDNKDYNTALKEI